MDILAKFIYDPSKPYECNFHEWYIRNTTERKYFSDKIYKRKEAKEVFCRLYPRVTSAHS
jgi:hypothetical protein